MTLESQKYYGGEDGRKLDWAISYIKDYYVDDVDSTLLVDEAIRTFVSMLDPNCSYESKEEAEIRKNKDKGIAPKSTGFKFYFVDANTATISRVIPQSPAEKAGLRRGYVINKVNGIIFNNDTYDEVKAILEDKKKDEIEITYVDYDRNVHTTILTKTSLPWFSVLSHYMVDNKTGYIKLRRFNSITVDEMLTSIESLKKSGMKNLILDMRNNNGGVKNVSIELADYFLPKDKLISYTDGANIDGEKFMSTDKSAFAKGKLICLVDDYTASASEIFLGALQDWDRCLIMGDLTYGKGTIQQSYRLGDGSTLRITIGKYYTPSGRHLHKQEEDNKWIEANKTHIPASGLTSEAKFSSDFFTKTMSGRRIATANGGIVPDMYYIPESDDRSTLKALDLKGNLYRFALTYAFRNRKQLLSKYTSASDFRKDQSFDASITDDIWQFYTQRGFEQFDDKDFVIPDNVYAQVRVWMADFLWDDSAYYELDNASDPLMQKAIEVINSRQFDKLKIKY